MWIFIFLLCLIGTVLTLVRTSLLERKGMVLLPAAAIALASLGAIPWAVRINTQELSHHLGRIDVLNGLCTLLVIESLATLLLSARLMKQHAMHRPMGLTTLAALCPSSASLAGIFVLMVLLFNGITGRSYMVIGGLYSVGVCLALAAGAFLVRYLVSFWHVRLEMILVLSFVQLVFAMFLPLVARGFAVPPHVTRNHAVALLASAGLSLLSAALAFLIRMLYNVFLGDEAQ